MQQLRTLLLFSTGLALASCSRNAGELAAAANRSGVFLDSPVFNLAYGDGLRTDEDGTFAHRRAADLEFRIGDILLGTARGAEIVTPVSLVPGAEDEALPELVPGVSNRARFLQTLDADADPSNGIEIPEDMHERATGLSVDFDVPSDQFVVDSEEVVTLLTRSAFGARRELVLAQVAEAHLAGTLVAARAGTYRGEIGPAEGVEGDLGGSAIEFFIDRTGRSCGWVEVFPGGPIQSLTGQGTSGGQYTLSVAAFGGTNFTATTVDGELTGTWFDPLNEVGGEWSAARVDTVDPFLGAGVAPLVGTYVGSSSFGDELVATVDEFGNVGFSSPYVCGALLSVDADGTGVMVGISIQGDLVQGEIDIDGNFTGTIESPIGVGTFELTR